MLALLLANHPGVAPPSGLRALLDPQRMDPGPSVVGGLMSLLWVGPPGAPISRELVKSDQRHQRVTQAAALLTDLRRPGHVFPLRSRPGGVLQRVGQTEASVDLARLAGLRPAGVICEILNPDGTMARRPELEVFSREHGLTMVTVAQLVAYRLQTERLVRRNAPDARANIAQIQLIAQMADIHLDDVRILNFSVHHESRLVQ